MTVEVLSSRRIEELRQETQADHLCRRLSEVVAVGWSNSSKKLPHDLRQFYAIRDELTVDNGLLLRGQCFVIPHSLKHYYTRLAMGPYSSRRFWVGGGGDTPGTYRLVPWLVWNRPAPKHDQCNSYNQAKVPLFHPWSSSADNDWQRSIFHKQGVPRICPHMGFLPCHQQPTLPWNQMG